jgi:hypothetical protein
MVVPLMSICLSVISMHAMEQATETSNDFVPFCQSSCTKFTQEQTNMLQEIFNTVHVQEQPGTRREFSETILIHQQETPIFKRRLTFAKYNASMRRPFVRLHIDSEMSFAEVLETLEDIYTYLPKGTLNGRNVNVLVYLKGRHVWARYREYKKWVNS